MARNTVPLAALLIVSLSGSAAAEPPGAVTAVAAPDHRVGFGFGVGHVSLSDDDPGEGEGAWVAVHYRVGPAARVLVELGQIDLDGFFEQRLDRHLTAGFALDLIQIGNRDGLGLAPFIALGAGVTATEREYADIDMRPHVEAGGGLTLSLTPRISLVGDARIGLREPPEPVFYADDFARTDSVADILPATPPGREQFTRFQASAVVFF